MHGWETRMLLKHYLDRGVSKAELSRRFGMSRRTIHEWVVTGQLDRDLSSGGSRYSPRPPVPHKLDPYARAGRVVGSVRGLVSQRRPFCSGMTRPARTPPSPQRKRPVALGGGPAWV